MVTLEETIVIHASIDHVFDLARSVEVHLLGNVHCGETAIANGGTTSGLLGMGQSVTWRARHLGVRQELTTRITAFDPPVYFRDTMLRGAFQSMEHDHIFRALSPSTTEMRDIFRFAAPLGFLGRIAESAVLRRYMEALLRERNSAVRKVAESQEWTSFLRPAPARERWLE